MFRPFNCVAYALITKDKRFAKFDSKACKAIMIGYTLHKKAYRLMDLGTRKIFYSQYVCFQSCFGETATIKDTKSKDVFPGDANSQ
jgi:hypothetical protein